MTEELDQNTALIQAALEGVQVTDSDLTGMKVHRWFVIGEFVDDANSTRTLSVFRSPNMTPWQSLGMLEFAAAQERFDLIRPDEDDDD